MVLVLHIREYCCFTDTGLYHLQRYPVGTLVTSLTVSCPAITSL